MAAARSAALEVLLALLPPPQPAHHHHHHHHHGGGCGGGCGGGREGEGDGGGDGGVATLLEGQLSTLVPGLLEGCGRGGGGVGVRCRSLECLQALPRLLPFHLLFPYQRQVPARPGARDPRTVSAEQRRGRDG